MKAQVISIDIMFAVLIVLIIISALGVLLYQYTIYDRQETELRELELRSEPALNVLMSTKGNPDNWESGSCSNIKSLGFMDQAAVLSENKLNAFTQLDYNCTQNLLGIAGYHYYFEMEYENGTIITAGYEPSAESDSIFSKRQALVKDTSGNNVIADITLGVWYE